MPVRIPALCPIDYLVVRKFSKLTPELMAGGEKGRYKQPDPVQLERIKLERIVAATAYRTELEQYPSEEIDALYMEEKAKEVEEIRLKAEATEKARPFNQPGANADFEHWSRASYWTIDEAVALSLGKNPKLVNLTLMKSHQSVSLFANRYVQLHELANRAIWAQQLWDCVLPSIFLGWARRMGIEVVPELVAAVEARGTQIGDWKTHYDDLGARYAELQAQHRKLCDEYVADCEKTSGTLRTSNQIMSEQRERIASLELQLADARKPEGKGILTRERDSLLRLVIGMAVEQYAFDPSASRNSATKEIASDLHTVGVGLDEDTVRKWLQEAAHLLPQTTE